MREAANYMAQFPYLGFDTEHGLRLKKGKSTKWFYSSYRPMTGLFFSG
jgi:hypothetical protein